MNYRIIVKEKDKIKTIFKEVISLGGGGANINDSIISPSTTWSSQKIDDELAVKADKINVLEKIAEIEIASNSSEIIISGLNHKYLILYCVFANSSGVHTNIDLLVSKDFGSTWLGFSKYGILATATGSFSTWNTGIAYIKNNSKLWGILKIFADSKLNTTYYDFPSRSTSNNRWRHSQGFINGDGDGITDIRFVAIASGSYFNAGSNIVVFGGK